MWKLVDVLPFSTNCRFTTSTKRSKRESWVSWDAWFFYHFNWEQANILFFVNTLGQLDKSRQGDGMSDLTQKLQCSKISQCPNRSRWWRPAMVVSSQVGWVDKLPSGYVKIVFEHDHRNSGNTHTHRIHGAAIYGNIYHQYTPVMLAYIPAPWILWDRTWWFSIVFCKRWPGRVASTEIDLGNLSWRLISF